MIIIIRSNKRLTAETGSIIYSAIVTSTITESEHSTKKGTNFIPFLLFNSYSSLLSNNYSIYLLRCQ